MKKRCKNCRKWFPVRKQGTNEFCKKDCHTEWQRKHSPSLNVSNELDIIANYTGGQLPHGILTDIGNKYGLTRERVRQIAMRKGLIGNREIIAGNKKIVCRNCKKIFEHGTLHTKIYCSNECATEWRDKTYFKTIACKQCGKEHKYLRSKRKPVFCSKFCQGKWFGLTSGKKTFYPKSPEQLKKDFPKMFTVTMFAMKYGYASHQGAWVAIADLTLRGVLKRVVRGVYKVI